MEFYYFINLISILAHAWQECMPKRQRKFGIRRQLVASLMVSSIIYPNFYGTCDYWAILYYWRTFSASTSEAKNMADLTPLPWLLVPRFMATTTVPTAVLTFRRCTSPPWFQLRYFMISLIFEVKIACALKILIFFSYNLVDLQRLRILPFCATRRCTRCTRRIFLFASKIFIYF
jgi:hypothetical protein